MNQFRVPQFHVLGRLRDYYILNLITVLLDKTLGIYSSFINRLEDRRKQKLKGIEWLAPCKYLETLNIDSIAVMMNNYASQYVKNATFNLPESSLLKEEIRKTFPNIRNYINLQCLTINFDNSDLEMVDIKVIGYVINSQKNKIQSLDLSFKLNFHL